MWFQYDEYSEKKYKPIRGDLKEYLYRTLGKNTVAHWVILDNQSVINDLVVDCWMNPDYMATAISESVEFLIDVAVKNLPTNPEPNEIYYPFLCNRNFYLVNVVSLRESTNKAQESKSIKRKTNAKGKIAKKTAIKKRK